MENDLKKSYLKILLPILIILLIILLIIGVVIGYFALDMNTKLNKAL